MASFVADLTSGNSSARTKNAMTGIRGSLMSSWTKWILMATSTATLKIKASINKITTSVNTTIVIRGKTRRLRMTRTRMIIVRMRQNKIRRTFIKNKNFDVKLLIFSHHCRGKRSCRAKMFKSSFFSKQLRPKFFKSESTISLPRTTHQNVLYSEERPFRAKITISTSSKKTLSTKR